MHHVAYEEGFEDGMAWVGPLRNNNCVRGVHGSSPESHASIWREVEAISRHDKRKKFKFGEALSISRKQKKVKWHVLGEQHSRLLESKLDKGGTLSVSDTQ